MFVSGGTLVTKTPIGATPSSFPVTFLPAMAGSWASQSYGLLYERHLWVYVVVNKLAGGIARLPLPCYRRGEMDRPRWSDHPMAKLLAHPNPALSPFHMWFWVSATRDIHGKAVLYKGRDDAGTVRSLWPLHPTSLTRDPRTGLSRFDNGRLVIDDIPARDLVVFKHYHPTSLDDGLSPLEPLRATLENEWNARSATSAFWANGARPGVILTHPNRISPEAALRLKAQWDAATTGASNRGATVVLEEGMKPEVMQLTSEEAQYIETRRLNREEVCAAYDIPPPAVHILDHATFSNITEQFRSVYRDTQGPRARSFEATIELDLRAVEWPDDEVYAEFLMDEVLRGDFEGRQDALAKASHMTIAEKRRVENLPFIAGTDRIFLNTATMPLDAIDAQTAASVREAPISVTFARSVLGRLSWQSDLSDVVDDDLVREVPEPAASTIREAIAAERETGGSVESLRARIKTLKEGP